MAFTHQSPEIPLEACSPDLQFRIQQQRKRNEAIADWSITLLCLGMTAIVVIEPVNNACRQFTRQLLGTWQRVEQAKQKVDTAIDAIAPDFQRPLREGEKLAGYEVTSRFNPTRKHPVTGEIRPHNGVDLATPKGTALYAIGQPGETLQIECLEESGAGKYARWKSRQFPNLEFYAMHLSKCASGKQPAGSVIALTGNTGLSSGPHLHWGVKQDGRWIDPPLWSAFWALQGNAPKAPIERRSAP